MVTVVVLPLLPVTQINFALVYRDANSISEMIGVPCFLSTCTSAAVSGMPGLLIISSAFRIKLSVC